jgi:hypothetical protein
VNKRQRFTSYLFAATIVGISCGICLVGSCMFYDMEIMGDKMVDHCFLCHRTQELHKVGALNVCIVCVQRALISHFKVKPFLLRGKEEEKGRDEPAGGTERYCHGCFQLLKPHEIKYCHNCSAWLGGMEATAKVTGGEPEKQGGGYQEAGEPEKVATKGSDEAAWSPADYKMVDKGVGQWIQCEHRETRKTVFITYMDGEFIMLEQV